MKTYDVEELLIIYDRFVEIVKQTSLSAEQQIERLQGTVVTDEIADDFSEIGMQYADVLLENDWITMEQFLLAKAIDKLFEEMAENKELWSENALRNAPKWEECRKIGEQLLADMSGKGKVL